ncbi:ribbon-helix-helix protein, CopG family [Oxalobacteraceae bacterium]|nr:ribbon-helix-helix protein, CopG family [Oxalobacteraceae bacterium]
MSSSNTRPVTIRIDQDTLDRVKHLADTRQRTPHCLMKEAIQQYLDREEKRETFRNDTLNAWKESQTTGMHAGADEVSAWLETWGDDDELAALKCHK